MPHTLIDNNKFLLLGKTGRLIFFEKIVTEDMEIYFRKRKDYWTNKEIQNAYFFSIPDKKTSLISGNQNQFPFAFQIINLPKIESAEEAAEINKVIENGQGNILFLYDDENFSETIFFASKIYLKLDPKFSITDLLVFLKGIALPEEVDALKKFLKKQKFFESVDHSNSNWNIHTAFTEVQRTGKNFHHENVPVLAPAVNKMVPIRENVETKMRDTEKSSIDPKPIYPPVVHEKIQTNPTEQEKEAGSKKENPSQKENSDKPITSEQIISQTDSPTWSLQVKMMGVISSIFAITLSVIIFLATYFFKTDNKVRILENSLELVNVIGAKVSTDISATVEKGREIAQTLNQGSESGKSKDFFIHMLFESDPHFVMLGIYKKDESHLFPIRNVFNKRHLEEKKISETDLTDLISKNESIFLESFNGKSLLQNLTPKFKEKIFAVSLPAGSSGKVNAILIMIVNLEKIQSAFGKGGAFETFIVNRNGLVIAHQDEKIIQSGADFSKLPIVQNMQSSAIGNGNVIYKNPDGKNYLGSFKKIGFADSGVITTISEDKAFQAVYEIQERNIYIMIISLSASLMIVFFFAKSISRPVLKLLTATLKIARGDFKVDIVPTTRDEVGVLTNYFIKMGQGLEEREKVKSILGSMIDPTVVKEAMIDMAALKRGSEKRITAFFSDVAGFSTISEQLTSIQLASLLNEYLGAMTIILKKYDGVLDKYIGDAIVGIFNAPVDIETPELCAAKASIEMIEKLKELRVYWTENNLYSKDAQEMDVRIGLNTGLAKVGFMGTDALASYTMMGDTVNLAARLEAAGKDYGVNILISETMNDAIQSEMFTRKLDLVRVKGKNEPVKIYELISGKENVNPKITEATKLYEEGLELYLQQNWKAAIEKFHGSQNAKGTKDKAVKMLIERCEDYKLNPPGKDWDGVFTRTHK